jgi:hypothetical protein
MTTPHPPQSRAVLAALCHDLAGIRIQLDLLSDDELRALHGAAWDVAVEIKLTLRDRGSSMYPACP